MGGVQGLGCVLECGPPQVPATGAEALEQVEKLRMQMLNLAPPHLCSGWDPLVPGRRSPGLENLPALSIGASAPGP